MSTGGMTPAPRGKANRATISVVGGMALAALAAYGYQVIAGRALGASRFSPVSALWTIQFLFLTVVLVPVEQLIVRYLARGGSTRSAAREIGPAIGTLIATSMVLGSLVVVSQRDRLFDGSWGYLLTAFGVFVGFSLYMVVRGLLAGRRQFGAYGLLVGGEAVSRTAAAGLVAWLIAEPVWFGWAMVAGTPFALLVLVRSPTSQSGRLPPRGMDEFESPGFLLALTAGNGAAQTLLGVGPLLVGLLGATPGEVSAFFGVFTLARGPLTMSTALLARFLPALVDHVHARRFDRLWGWSRTCAAVAVMASVIGGVCAYQFGPALTAALYGPSFRPDAGVIALVSMGAALGAGTFFGGQALVAMGRVGLLAGCWILGLVVAGVVVLVVGGDPPFRVALSFALGETVALPCALVSVRLALSRERCTASSEGLNPARPSGCRERG